MNTANRPINQDTKKKRKEKKRFEKKASDINVLLWTSFCSLLGADILVLLLSLFEGLLEGVGVWTEIYVRTEPFYMNEIFLGQSLTLTVGKADSQCSRLRLTLTNICGGVPHPATVTADIGVQLHVGDD